MCIFPSFLSGIHVAVAELIVYGMDCIARVVADKPGGSQYRNRTCATCSQIKGKWSDPSDRWSLFSFNGSLLFLFTPSPGIWPQSTTHHAQLYEMLMCCYHFCLSWVHSWKVMLSPYSWISFYVYIFRLHKISDAKIVSIHNCVAQQL
jgi:hypothetical protein